MFGFATPPKFMICIYNLQYGILKEFLPRVIRSPPLKLIKVLLGQSAHKIEIENMRAHCKTLIKTCNGLISIMKEHYSFHIFFFTFKVNQPPAIHNLYWHKFTISWYNVWSENKYTKHCSNNTLLFLVYLFS